MMLYKNEHSDAEVSTFFEGENKNCSRLLMFDDDQNIKHAIIHGRS